ncbi:MAG TPA: hypothetical protein VEA16_04210, partial [Vicinamibacterales bacterium]|nr:hypothetical protein [Vicinamibacterales bacterium]
FILAAANDADTPYMALKMMYLAIYPMAVLGAFAVTRLTGESRVTEPLGWLVAAALVIAARPVFNAPRPIPVVDADLYAAGKLVRAQGAAACVDYLVTDSQTAYWLHLAVLGNPRSSDRTREIDVYDPNAAIAPWITAAGRNYAIADLRLLPDEVRSQVDIAAQIGHAAVITRRGVTMKGCD